MSQLSPLEALRARLAAQEASRTKSKRSDEPREPNALYRHWDIDEGTVAKIRFLPDRDPSNVYYWMESNRITLPFNGIKGKPDVKRVEVKVPCIETPYWDPAGKTRCPILQEVRTWYKDASLVDQANAYWKKRSYFFQGFVRQNPIKSDVAPENPIRKFIFTPQIYNIIHASMLDPEFKIMPPSYDNGIDFNIKKTFKGTYAGYETSGWAYEKSPLTEAELAAIDQYGLFNLADFLPKKPGEAELKVMFEMFEASVDGQEYDPDRWGDFYRPFELGNDKETVETADGIIVPTAEKAPVEVKKVETTKAKVAPVTTSPASDKTDAILAMIRNRQAKA